MFSKLNRTECLAAFGLCLVFAFVMKSNYAARIEEERRVHASNERFERVVGTMHTYEKYRDAEYRGTRRTGRRVRYTTKYNIKYSYIVNDVVYYKTVYDKSSLDSTITLYYNPSNPQQNSFYATYEDAVEGFQMVKTISDILVILTILVGGVAIYRIFIYKTPSELAGTVVQDDFSSFGDSNKYDDNNTFDQEKILKDYGVVATDDFAFVSTVHPSVAMPERGEKQVVDKVETIAFPGKKSTDTKFELYTEQEYKDMMKKEN